MTTKFSKNAEANSKATQLLAWSEYRELFDNEMESQAGRYVRATYKKASSRQTVRTIYLPVLPYVVDVAAPAMDLPFKVSGPPAFKALLRKWRPTLSRCWKVRKAAGSSYPHVARRRGRLILELLWGDALTITPDPACPSEWDFLLQIEIPMTDGGRLLYLKDKETNRVSAAIVDEDKFRVQSPLLDDWGVIPVFPMYRDGTGRLQPSADRTLLDLHIDVLLMLTDADFRRKYRTAILWRKSDLQQENRSAGGGDIEGSPDAVAELGENEMIGIVESALRSTDDLDYVERFLRLAAKLLKMPPELFITTSRAETGSAKGWDYRPLMELQQKDREEADEWLAGFVEGARPILEAEGILSAGDKPEVATVPAKLPYPADPQQYALGVESMMKMGLTSPVREISMREGVGYAEAARLVKINIEQSRVLERRADKTDKKVVDGGAPNASIGVEVDEAT